jgi:translation initiation factor 1
VLPLIEGKVMDLVARLLAGGRRREARLPEAVTAEVCGVCRQPAEKCRCRTQTPPAPAGKGTVRVARETKGRRGKGVTTVSDLPLDEAGLRDLAARLKQRCGTGGTVKEGQIEIQGDQRDRVAAELEKLGYRVKRSGG